MKIISFFLFFFWGGGGGGGGGAAGGSEGWLNNSQNQTTIDVTLFWYPEKKSYLKIVCIE